MECNGRDDRAREGAASGCAPVRRGGGGGEEEGRGRKTRFSPQPPTHSTTESSGNLPPSRPSRGGEEKGVGASGWLR